MTEEEAERAAESERVGRERETGEAELMDEILEAEHVLSAPPPTTPRRSQRMVFVSYFILSIALIHAQTSVLIVCFIKMQMPTPNVQATHGTGGTPSPSKLQPHEAGTSKRGRPKLPVRKFKVPRKTGL